MGRMMVERASKVRIAAWILGCAGMAFAVPSVAAAAQAVGYGREAPADALARNMRTLAVSPKNFEALIGAGKAALAVGDVSAAIGFFGRADEVHPASPLPQAGIGAAMVADGDAHGALPHFARAQQLGANAAMMGVDRGLAYDLLGRHAEAQADYRAAMYGPDADEARRRLALSLAITGKKQEALDQLAPLLARGDAAGARCRSLVLALSGDMDGARRMLDAAMPGSGSQMAYFFAKLPSLRSDQKAAAVNLGIFPTASQPVYAAPSAPPQPVYSAPPRASIAATTAISGAVTPMSSDRLASVDELLRSSARHSQDQGVQVASVVPMRRSQSISDSVATPAKPKVWLQLASGPNADALPDQFKKMKSRNRDLFEGISGYVAEEPNKARLLIGPFASNKDAEIFAKDLQTVRIDAFSWTNTPGQPLRKLSTE